MEGALSFSAEFVGALTEASCAPVATASTTTCLDVRPMRRGDTPLLHALRDENCSVDTVKAILDNTSSPSERHRLVNARCNEGFTPLMLAVSRGGGFGGEAAEKMVAVARFLLTNGATATLNAHAGKRRTAAEYAEIHGKRRLAEEIRCLQRQQQADSIPSSSPVVGNAGATATEPSSPRPSAVGSITGATNAQDIVVWTAGQKHSHCRLCGDRLSGCKFRTAKKEVSAALQTNRLLVEQFSQGGLMSSCSTLDRLSSPALHHVNQRKGFTRELTEALAMLKRLQRIVACDGNHPGPWHVIDLCCGKGFLATLAAVTFPDFTVTAVDIRPPTFLPHFEAAGISNVEYAQLDVLAPSFPIQIQQLVQSHGGRPAVVLGMHLCGLLSVQALELLGKVLGVRAVVLAPCCLPNSKFAGDTPSTVYEGTDQFAKFVKWCDFLEQRMKSIKPPPPVDVGPLAPPDPTATLSPNGQGNQSFEVSRGPPGDPTAMCGEPTLRCSREIEDGIISTRRTLLTAQWGVP